MEPQNYVSEHLQGDLPSSMMWIPGQSTEFSLDEELEALRNSPQWLSGIARKQLIKYPDFQVTLRRMNPSTRIPEHFNEGRICVQTVFGHIRGTLPEGYLICFLASVWCLIVPSCTTWKRSTKVHSC